MSGVLLKKKKKIVVKKKYTPRVWRTRWTSRRLRRKFKKLSFYPGPNLEKKKTSVLSSSAKKYKVMKRKVDCNETIKKYGTGVTPVGLFSYRCKKACKLNFSTIIGIKKKLQQKKSNSQIFFRKFPSIQQTRKSTGHRMGKGKGKFTSKVAVFKKGESIIGTTYFDEVIFSRFYRSLQLSLPVQTKRFVNYPLFLASLKSAEKLEGHFNRVPRRKPKWPRRKKK